ncbi:MAG: hypothetical protein M1520_02115 [Candidatus Marsarchaeota archaeon]|nr:hypothetical protein [Candidatus Marsarchaeota archaeon]
MGRREEMLRSELCSEEISNEEALALLSEYAYEYPESRTELAETLEAYSERTGSESRRYGAISAADEIRAIEMLEALCADL